MSGYSFVYIDIETLPDLSMSIEDREKLARAKVPKNIKDPEKIAARVKANLEDPNGAFARTAVSPTGCLVYTISFAVGDGKIFTTQENYEDDIGKIDPAEMCPYRTLESRLTERFREKLFQEINGARPHFVAHNGMDFDFPILRLRGVSSMPSRRFTDKHTDTQLLAQGTAKGGAGYSLEALCGLLGLGGKADGMHGMHGSQVYQAWTEGRHDEVARYCARDIHLLRRLHLRLIGEET